MQKGRQLGLCCCSTFHIDIAELDSMMLAQNLFYLLLGFFLGMSSGCRLEKTSDSVS